MLDRLPFCRNDLMTVIGLCLLAPSATTRMAQCPDRHPDMNVAYTTKVV